MEQNMFLSHGGRPAKGNGRKRKGVDEYAAENRVDFTSRSIIRDGQLVRILVCRFCCQSIGARSDRIKEHLASKRHQKLKMEAFREAQEAGRDLSQEYSDDSSGLLPEPPITMLKFPGKALAHLLDGEGRHPARELTPDQEDCKYAIQTPPPLKEHIMNSPPSQNSVHPALQQQQQQQQHQQQHAIRGGIGGIGIGGVNSNNNSVSPPPIPAREPANASPQQLLCVRWGNFDSNIVSMFTKLRSQEQFVDVTLWCEGRTIKAHKMILVACSTYFEQLLTSESPNLHPIIFLKDMKFWEIQALVEFMYKGEVSIHQEKLQSLLRAAESLQIKGLGSPSSEQQNAANQSQQMSNEDENNSSSAGSNNTSSMDMSTASGINHVSMHTNNSTLNLSNSLNNHYSHPSPMNLNMGIDLSNHGNHNNIGSSLSSPQNAPPQAKRRRKETPRRIDIPRVIPNLAFNVGSISLTRDDDNMVNIEDEDRGEDNDDNDSISAHESRNHIDVSDVKCEGENENMVDGDNGQENYTENDHGGSQSGEEESGGEEERDEMEENGDLQMTPQQMEILRLNAQNLVRKERERDRERSRKGNPIKKIHLGIGNNNNNNNETTTAGGTTIIENSSGN